MLPVWKAIAVSIGQLAASRVIIDGVDIPSDKAEMALERIDEIKSWVDITKDLDLSKPHTIATFALNFTREVLNRSSQDALPSVIKYMADRQYALTSDEFKWIAYEAIHFAESIFGDSKIEKEFDNFMLLRQKLGNGQTLYYTSGHPHMDLMFAPLESDNGFRDSIADCIWSEGKSLLLDWDDEDLVLIETDEDRDEFKGEKLGYIEEWKRYIEADQKHTVLLQGRQGTGKTTFVHHVRKELSDRTLIVSNTVLPNINKVMWQDTMYWLKPTMVVVDDIDYIASSLSRHLYLFEDGMYSVPLTLITANNYLTLPAAARRPGRIDQILAMNTPEEEAIEREVRQYMADRGLIESTDEEVPEDTMEFLCDVHREYSGAGTQELCKRMAVHGLSYRPADDDITFGKVTGDIGLDTIVSEGEYLGTSSAGGYEADSGGYERLRSYETVESDERKQIGAIRKLLDRAKK